MFLFEFFFPVFRLSVARSIFVFAIGLLNSLENFLLTDLNGYCWVGRYIMKFSDFDFSVDGFGFRWRNQVGL
jgi:hypothetical protein